MPPPVQALLMLSAGWITLPLWCWLGARECGRWLGEDNERALRRIPIWAWVGVMILCSLLIAARPPFIDDWPWSIASGVLSALLLALVRIDVACRLLPDSLTLSLIGLGLLSSMLIGQVTLANSVIGAIAGYSSLWCLRWLFLQLRAAEAMGRGDLSMTAGIGACLGWQMLPFALLVASSAALIAVVMQRLVGRVMPRSAQPIGEPTSDKAADHAPFLRHEIPFGPALALGLAIGWWQLG